MIQPEADCAVGRIVLTEERNVGNQTVGAGVFATPAKTLSAVALVLALGVELTASLSGSDATWDLRNYHSYNPFALLNKPFGVDIAPAHMQTFFAPTMDLFYYGLARLVPNTPLLNALVSIPHALAVVLKFGLTCRLLRPGTAMDALAIGVFVAIGATGAAGGATIATTGSEMLPACLILLAVLTLTPADLGSTPSTRRVLAAGLLAGAACGLKLTFSYLAAGLGLALFLIPRRLLRDLVTRPAAFGAGVLIGALALSGYWWAHQWLHYGNPFFPTMNDVFRSPLAVPDSFVDRTFLPGSLAEALGAPWIWTLRWGREVIAKPAWVIPSRVSSSARSWAAASTV